MATANENGFTNENGMNPIIFSKKVALEYTKLSNKTLDNMTNTQWEGEIKAQGDRVRIVLPNADQIEIADGETCPVPQGVPPEALDLVIDKQKSFALAITDKEKAQTQFKNYIDAMASAVARKVSDVKNKDVQRLILEYTPGAKQEGVYDPALHPLAGDFGTDAAPVELTPQNIYMFMLQVKMALVESGAIEDDGTYSFKGLGSEMQEKRGVFICGTRLASILLAAYQVAGRSTSEVDMVIKDGVVTRVAGLDILIDRTLDSLETKAASGASGTAKKVTNLPFIAGTKNAVTQASQISKVENIRDPYCFQDIVRGLELYGMKLVHPEAIVRGFAKKKEFSEFDAAIPVDVVRQAQAQPGA